MSKKKTEHPDYHNLILVLPDGTEVEVGTTFRPRGDSKKFKLGTDFRKHSAWSKKGVSELNQQASKVNKFNDKFGSFGL